MAGVPKCACETWQEINYPKTVCLIENFVNCFVILVTYLVYYGKDRCWQLLASVNYTKKRIVLQLTMATQVVNCFTALF